MKRITSPRCTWGRLGLMLWVWGALFLVARGDAAGIKEPMVGLVAMGNIGFHNSDDGVGGNSLEKVRKVPGVFAGVVVNVTWRQIEPERGAFDTGEIDRFLGEIRAYNRENPGRPLAARLRVWPGPNAPLWAKQLGGGPVAMERKGKPTTIGKYWDPAYREAWRELQNRLAEKYDAEPLIREVTNTTGSAETDEPFNLSGDKFTIDNLLAAGFKDALFADTLRQSYLDYAGWKTTPVEWSFSPYRELESGKPRPKWEYTVEMMRWWREKMGPRGVLGNHSLNIPVADHLKFIYEEIGTLGPPAGVQTHSPGGLDWEGAIRFAAGTGIGSVELWEGTQFGGYETRDAETLGRWAGMLGDKY